MADLSFHAIYISSRDEADPQITPAVMYMQGTSLKVFALLAATFTGSVFVLSLMFRQ